MVSVSWAGSSSASASSAGGTSSSLGCDTESEDGVEDSIVEGKRRFPAVKLPRRRALALTVTNKEEDDEEDSCELEGTGRASRNPGGRRCRLARGPFCVEFSRFDMGMYMVHRTIK